MMPPEFISTEPCDVHLIDTSPAPTSDAANEDGRKAFDRYIADCEGCAIVPDVAGAFHWAWTHAAPLQHEARLTEKREAVIAECLAALRDVDDGEAPKFSACIERLQALRLIATQPAQNDSPMVWPKARDVGRIGDMSPRAHMRVGFDSDSDVFISVWSDDGGGSVEFCTAGAGGGKSPRTREALIGLMVAMEGDNAIDPGRDWWARRNGKPTQGAEGGSDA